MRYKDINAEPPSLNRAYGDNTPTDADYGDMLESERKERDDYVNGDNDVSPDLNTDKASRFLQLIGIPRWIVELGGIDIYHEISILSKHQAMPRENHLEALYHVFA